MASTGMRFQKGDIYGQSLAFDAPQTQAENCPDVLLPPVALIDLLQTPACIINDAGIISHANAAWQHYARVTGLGASHLPWEEVIQPEDRDLAQSQLRAASMVSQPVSFECRLRRHNADPHWFLVNLQPLQQTPQAPTHWLCTGTDIQAIKHQQAQLEARVAIQSDMLDISIDCIKLIAIDGSLLHMNKAGCLALGVPLDSSFGMPWLTLLPEEVREAGEQALADVRQYQTSVFTGHSKLPNQLPQYWSNMLTPVIGTDGKLSSILCISREVTAERQAIEALQASEERLSTAVRVGGLGIWDFNIIQNTMHCDDAWHSIMGRDSAFPIQSISEFIPIIHPEDVELATEVKESAARLLAANEDYTVVFRIIRPNGDIRWLRSAACLIADTDGNAIRAIGFVKDITETWLTELTLRDSNRALIAEKQSLEKQSLEDPLTGIANRRQWDKKLAEICYHAQETGQPLTVGMIDVDNFKAYNDHYGHPDGDIVLRKIATALQSFTQSPNLAARFGGEEFAFVLPDLEDPSPLLQELQETIRTLAIPHECSSSGYVTISCGCIVIRDATKLTPCDMIKASDNMLYKAKAAGRNRFVISHQ